MEELNITIKPSELEQKAAEKQRSAFERQVQELDGKIEEHLLSLADRIGQLGLVGYSIITKPATYGEKVIPEAAVLAVVEKYEAAGWNVHRVEQGYHTVLLFAPKDSQK
ncbi:MAG: hypothetical protein AABW48_05365 [Nanoarchaeota archaeon]